MNAQLLAARAVAAVIAGRSLTSVLARLSEPISKLTDAQRGALWDLAHGTLRELGLLRAVLRQFLHKPIEQTEIVALLAVGLFQLEFTRAAPYAVVNQAVTNTEREGRPWAKGMVNAVLRRFQREREVALATARASEEGRYSYPKWWIERVRSEYPQEWQRILEAGNHRARLALRVNRRRGTRDEYMARLFDAGIGARAELDSGVLLEDTLPVARLPGFAQGLASVQDLGAQRAAPYLAAEPGDRVLDACAAPGGKTAHVLERSDVELLALDTDAARVARLEENLQRLGLHALVVCADATDPDAWWDGRPFDRILVDVPCTGSGVVRRHPDIKWLRREADIPALAARAQRMLDALWRLLKPGGKLLYVTCSIFREENRMQVDNFVGRHADAQRALLPAEFGHDMQLLPDASHDGFYYALLARR